MVGMKAALSIVCLYCVLVVSTAESSAEGVRRFRENVARLSGHQPPAAAATPQSHSEPQQQPQQHQPLSEQSPDTDAAAYAAFIEEQSYAHALAYAQQQADLNAQAQANAVAWEQYMQAKHPQQQEKPGASDSTSAPDASFVETGAKWGFGRSFQPQLYGYWQQKNGNWNFGNDKRIECEACTYVLYSLVSRLGDQFNREIIKQEAEGTCARVQWVFKSTCDFVLGKAPNLATVSDLVMKLIEPHDICKHLDLCQPDMMDMMGMGGMNGFSPTRMGITLPPSVRARMADMRMGAGSGSGSGSASGSAAGGAASGMMNGFAMPSLYSAHTLPYGQLPIGLQPLSPQDLYGVMPGTFFGGKGSGSGSGS